MVCELWKVTASTVEVKLMQAYLLFNPWRSLIALQPLCRANFPSGSNDECSWQRSSRLIIKHGKRGKCGKREPKQQQQQQFSYFFQELRRGGGERQQSGEQEVFKTIKRERLPTTGSSRMPLQLISLVLIRYFYAYFVHIFNKTRCKYEYMLYCMFNINIIGLWRPVFLIIFIYI